MGLPTGILTTANACETGVLRPTLMVERVSHAKTGERGQLQRRNSREFELTRPENLVTTLKAEDGEGEVGRGEESGNIHSNLSEIARL